MATWPTAADYVAAVQNPRQAFTDASLKTARSKLTALGLPVYASGNFATVFRMQISGGQEFAVRCFTRPVVADQQQRYAALSGHFAAAKLQSLVSFEYLVRGIRINSQWLPVVKMEWLRGKGFYRAVEDKIGDRDKLEVWPLHH